MTMTLNTATQFSHKVLQLKVMCHQTKFGSKGLAVQNKSSKSHIFVIETFIVTLTLKIAQQFFSTWHSSRWCTTLPRLVKGQAVQKFIVWTKSGQMDSDSNVYTPLNFVNIITVCPFRATTNFQTFGCRQKFPLKKQCSISYQIQWDPLKIFLSHKTLHRTNCLKYPWCMLPPPWIFCSESLRKISVKSVKKK